jgi:hypothetical protein
MSTFNGFGTRFYGAKSKQADGSYVTTKWITAAWLPIFPLGSLRIRKVGKGGWGVFFYTHSTTQYEILGNVPMSANLLQVVLTWLWVLVPLFFVILGAIVEPHKKSAALSVDVTQVVNMDSENRRPV